jgi:hypothetical protein
LLLVSSPYAVGRMTRSLSKSWGDAIEIDGRRAFEATNKVLLEHGDLFEFFVIQNCAAALAKLAAA